MKIPVSRWWGRGPRVCFALVLALCAPDCSTTSSPDLGVDAAPSGPMRSTLYPATWDPSFTDASGRFLHDFSYAGYQNGEAPLPTVSGPMVRDIARDHGADPTGQRDATAAIQAAIDAVSPTGGVVQVPEGRFRVDGLLTVRASGVVVRGLDPTRSQLQFTKVTSMTGRSHLTFVGALKPEALRPLAAEGPNRATAVTLAAADLGGLAVGDDIDVGWLISDAFIAEHQMTGIWSISNGQYRPIFRRQVAGLDAASGRVQLDVPLRYPAKLRDQAALRRTSGYLSRCGVEDLGISNAVDYPTAWTQVRVHAIEMTNVKDSWIRGVASFAAPQPEARGYHLQNGGILIKESKRVTIADTHLAKAQNRGDGGSGYLYEVYTSNEVLIRDSEGVAGRHNFIQNWDFGTTGCVFLRDRSAEGLAFAAIDDKYPQNGTSEFHHSLAMACLIDSNVIEDGWAARNRLYESTNAGVTATQTVFWNSQGNGRLYSYQSGDGYVIGTRGLTVYTELSALPGVPATAPEDFHEALDDGARLEPQSLYDDQLRRRLARKGQ